MRKTRVKFLDRVVGSARVDREVAAWICRCGDPIHLIGRAAQKTNGATICPSCGRKYDVVATASGSDAAIVTEIT